MTARRALFVKLIVRDLAAVQDFYTRAFGFAEQHRVTADHMEEVIMALPDDGFSLVLYRHTDGRDVAVGTGHGPIGLQTRDIQATWDAAIAAGGREVTAPFDYPGMRIAFLDDPEGHALELIQYVKASEGAER